MSLIVDLFKTQSYEPTDPLDPTNFPSLSKFASTNNLNNYLKAMVEYESISIDQSSYAGALATQIGSAK